MTVTINAPHTEISSETLKTVVFSSFVKEYKITSADIPMLTNIIKTLEEPVIIERAHYEEDLEIVKPDEYGDKES